MEKEILEYLKSKTPKFCVMSTISRDNKPECAVMGYSIFDDLTLLLSTHNTSRKWINLKNNPNVAIAIGWSFTEMFVQSEGVVELIFEDGEYTKCEEFHFSQNPEAKKFKSPETVYIKVKPKWIRLSDYTKLPPRIEEKNI